MGFIELRGLQFKAYHGYYDEERERGNQFEVDIVLETDFSEAAAYDVLDGTIDYEDIYKIVQEHMQRPSRLLEHVVDNILNEIKQNFDAVSFAEVKVYKLNPPIGGPCRAAIVSNTFRR